MEFYLPFKFVSCHFNAEQDVHKSSALTGR